MPRLGFQRRSTADAAILKRNIIDLNARAPRLLLREIAGRLGCTQGYVSLVLKASGAPRRRAGWAEPIVTSPGRRSGEAADQSAAAPGRARFISGYRY